MPDSSHFPPLFGLSQRQLPANLQAEQAVLGSIFANNRAIDRCTGLEPRHFADPIHARIFRDCLAIIADGGLASPVTLKARYEHAGVLDEVGGTPYLVKLQSAMIDILSTGHYANTIRECSMRRALIAIGEDIGRTAFGADPDLTPLALMDQAGAAIGTLAADGAPDRTTSLQSAATAAMAALERAQHGDTAGISTGFKCFDARLGGLEPGLVYVIAGRPGMGKSSLATGIAVNVARAGKRVHILSLEMSATQIGRRVLSTAAKVPIYAMKGGRISNEDASALVMAQREMANLSLTIDDTAGLTPAQVLRACRAIKRSKGGLDLVMLDHLNLLRADDADARHGGTWATERASATILELAKELEVPVLLLAQLNRGVEGREDKRPTLSDLRQAGAIEQDADAVGFVFRPEYYLGGEPDRKEGENDEKFSARRHDWQRRKDEAAGVAEVIWGKVRDGETGIDTIRFHGPTASFMEAT